ncbi:hypothetical protein BJ322DRAFT_1019755 [Thelephora terrestris]|uniref:DUF6593 domain-containing protein n=1 Tax=Thelephora terrestris TaxID=56493 RepID=A0A9P6HHZ9_9AGAM|nr:hypothetical protein BJ322DRAFT_1019755 [Thelephora terrestris]
MSPTTPQSRRRSSSFRSWSTFFTSKPKTDALEILPNPSRTSGSDEGTTVSASSPCGSGPESTGVSDTRSSDPPSYAHAISRGESTTYRFVQNSAFSMTLLSQDGPQSAAYNISVGLNVWMPSEHITLLRRHADPEGPVLARLEMGIASANATVTIGDNTMPLSDLMPDIHSSSSSRRYHLGDGRVAKWKLGATTWEASLDNSPLANFSPSSRNLALHPPALSNFDDIVISILILMREYHTPKASQVGGAAGLFNYHPFSTNSE